MNGNQTGGYLNVEDTLGDLPGDMMRDDIYLYIPGSNVYGMNDHAMDSGMVVLEHVPETGIDRVLMGDMNDMEKEPKAVYQDIPMFSQDTLIIDDM